MTKAIKKVQQDIEIKTRKENIDTYSKKEIKQGEKWIKEMTKEVPTESRTIITVGNLIDWKKSGAMYFPSYQRGAVWDNTLKKGLIHTLVHKGHIPDMVFAQRENGKYENIDGKQRILTYEELSDNKFTLPSSIPVALGGGGLFKDADKRLQKHILSRPVGYTYLINPTDKQCQDTFLQLQQGVKLTVGEIIHGNYGHVATTVDKIANSHPINTVLTKDRFLNYRTINAMLMLESKYASNVDTKYELSFVNNGQEQEMFDTKTEKTFKKTLNRLVYCCGGEYVSGLSILRWVTLYVWLRRHKEIGATKNEGLKVNGFLNSYYKNMHEISSYMQNNNNVLLTEDALGYYTQLQQRRTSHTQIRLQSEHLDDQYKLFRENKMKVYLASAGNMCLKRDK